MAQSLQFFRRIMLLLNITVCVFLAWVFGMTPVLANMSAAGIVTFPGMMTGQLLAGADPLSAAKYQIVVMLMLSAANTVAIVTACYMTYSKRFAPDGYYLDKGLRG